MSDLNCPKCKKRMRPLKKRDKIGRVLRAIPGVHYCKSCEIQTINRKEVMAHRKAQKKILPNLTRESSGEDPTAA